VVEEQRDGEAARGERLEVTVPTELRPFLN
jgi:hypothetical protein